MNQTKPSDRKDLLVGIPCYTGDIASETTNSLLNSINLYHGIVWGIGCCHIGIARDNIAAQFLDGPWQKLLFVDTDIVFTPEQMERITSYDLPVVAGVYKLRSVDGALALCAWGSGNLALPEHRGLMHVRRAATGFMCITRAAFETIRSKFPNRAYVTKEGPRYNYFPAAYTVDAATNDPVVQTDDYGFCDLVNDAGLSIHVDLGVTVGHKGTIVYNVNFPPLKDQVVQVSPRPAGLPGLSETGPTANETSACCS